MTLTKIKLRAIKETRLPPVIEGELVHEDKYMWSVMTEDKVGYVIFKDEDYEIEIES